MANILDPSTMSDEELAAGAAEAQPGTEPTTTTPEVEPAPTEPVAPPDDPQPLITLDGESYTEEQLRAMRAGHLRQDDYTKKTQELAALRAQTGPLAELWDEWQRNPGSREAIVHALAVEAGVKVGQTAPTVTQPQTTGLLGTFDPSRSAEPEWEQRGYGSHVELMLDKERLELRRELSEFKNEVNAFKQSQTKASQMDTVSKTAASNLETELGMKAGSILPETVRDAMTATGIEDPEAAWMKHNAKNIANFLRGTTAKVEKPNAPAPSDTRTFDPMGDFSADRIVEMMSSGMVPVQS